MFFENFIILLNIVCTNTDYLESLPSCITQSPERSMLILLQSNKGHGRDNVLNLTFIECLLDA